MFKNITYKPVLILLLFLSILPACLFSQANPDPARFAGEISAFQQWDEKNSFPENALLFAGSSSVRMWKTHESFPQYNLLNRGFGGAHISDVIFYLNDVIIKYKPQVVAFYCGDNDIASQKTPEQVLADYKAMITRVREKLPNVQFIYIPIKPSISRWALWPEMEKTNKMIENYSNETPGLFYADLATPLLATGNPPSKEIFLEDGLHLSDKGYKIWTEALLPLLQQTVKQ